MVKEELKTENCSSAAAVQSNNGNNDSGTPAAKNNNGNAGNNNLKTKDNARKGVNTRSRSPNKRARSRSPVDRRRDSTKAARRVYVANVAFDVKWSDLKDLFREKVGNVLYCQLFEDEEGRSRGCGLVEFGDAAAAQRAIQQLHRFNYKGRELVVREDVDCERDQCGRMITNGKKEIMKDVGNRSRDERRFDRVPQQPQPFGTFNTYGLSPQFLDSLGVDGPLNNRIFVANLDYKVGEKKLEEIFRLAGKVLRVRLYTDANGASKGHGTVEFEHPVEAIQAISMFRNQNLYGREISIKIDRYECEEMPEVLPNVLPSGLESIGKGLGIGGQPLNVSKSLLNGAIGAPCVAPVPNAQQLLGPGGQPIAGGSTASIAANPFGAAGVPSYGQITGLGAAVTGPGVQSAIGQPLAGSVVGQVGQPMASNMGQMGMPGLGQPSNMNAQLGAGNQNLNQLANSAQNVLAAAASYSGNPMGQSLTAAIQQQSNAGLYGSGYEREFREDKFRSGGVGGVGAIGPNVGIGGGMGGNNPIGAGGQLVDTVLVRNLPLNFTWQNLRDRFNEIGDVRFAELKGRGMAVVRFSADRDAQRAVELMNGMRIDNRPIDVSLYY